MIAFVVKLNGKRVCLAGAEDLSVLTAGVTAVGQLGAKTLRRARPDDKEERDIFYSVGGLTSRRNAAKDVHLSWKSVERLKVGDVLEFKVIESSKTDRPKKRIPADRKRG